MGQRRKRMRLSRIIPILFLLFVTFAGTSMLCAGEKRVYDTPNGKFTVEFNDYKEIVRGVTPQGEVLSPKYISELGFIEKNDPRNIFYELKTFPAGEVIMTGPGDTCVWYFDGRRYVYYCF
jgi:hypothetical protein